MGEMVETIFAAVAQYGRSGNREQVMNRQRARLEAGFWVFHPPAGYVYLKDAAHKKLVVPDGARSKLVQEALEHFAMHRFATQHDIVVFFKQNGYFPSLANPFASKFKMAAHRLLANRWFYAGYVEYPAWGIARREGRHEPLISAETARRIDLRLDGRGEAPPVRRDADEELVLRNYVGCATCGRPLTGGFAKHKYPGYFCYNEGNCARYGHRIKLRALHGDFAALLQGLTSRDETIEVLGQVSEELWQERVREWRRGGGQTKTQLQEVDAKVATLTRRISLATNEGLVAAYEREVMRLAEDREELLKDQLLSGSVAPDYPAAFRRVCTILKDPYAVWDSGSDNQKKTVCRLVFATPPQYDRERGFCTIDLSVPYRVTSHLAAPESRMVDLTSKTLHLFIDTVLRWAEQPLVVAAAGQQ